MYAVLKVPQAACILSKDTLALHECRWLITCSSVARARPPGARSQPRVHVRRAEGQLRAPRAAGHPLETGGCAAAMHAPDPRAMGVRELDIRESCGSRRGGRVRLRAAQAAKSMKMSSTTAASGSASGGCAAAKDVLQWSTSPRRLSAASIVRAWRVGHVWRGARDARRAARWRR